MFLRTPQLIRPVMVWYDFKGQRPLNLVHKIKKQSFRLGENTTFCVVDTLPKIPADICCFFSSQQLFEFFQEPLGIWSVQGAAPAPHEHILSYCVTDGCIVEWPRSLCFKTMWAGKYLIPIRGPSPENLHERSMTYHRKVPENLHERSMTYHRKVPENFTRA